MTTLFIAELDSLGIDAKGNFVPNTPMMPPIAEQVIPFSGASSQSFAFGTNTRFVQISTDAVCCIAFGDDPTATTSNQRLAANERRFFGVVPGQKLAVIASA